MRRIRGAVGMGLTWGLAGILLGGAIELVHNVWPNPVGSAADIWPAVLALPGFAGGVAFSAVLSVAGRRRRFDQLSLPAVAAWGGLGGVMISLIPAAMVGAGLATPNARVWQITLGLLGPFVFGGALAASGSLALARAADDTELLSENQDVADIGLTPDEERELLGDPR